MSETSNGHITKDDLRAGLLNGYVRKKELFTTDQGFTIEIMQPTVGQRNRMLQAGGITGASNEITDLGGMQIAAIIECCVVPGTTKPLFDITDKDVLASLPTSSWFDEVATKCMTLMNAEGNEAGKPLSKTTSDSTSSSLPLNLEEQSPS